MVNQKLLYPQQLYFFGRQERMIIPLKIHLPLKFIYFEKYISKW